MSSGDSPRADTTDTGEATLVGEESSGAATSSAARLDVGATIGRYRLQTVLGRGGQGTVWSAVDTELGRVVALKLVHGKNDGAARARLLREARALAQLQHPNVVKIFDAFVHGDELVLAMELVDGCDLNAWCRTQQPTLAQRLDVIEAAGRAIVAAHEAGLVHRDFKPSNVLVARDGRVVVTDFGLVSKSPTLNGPVDASFVTDPRARIGTLGYMAPEQVLGGAVDAAADQFAFCVVCYEMLHLRRLFGDRDFGETAHAMSLRRPRSPRSPGVPRRLAAIVERGLDPDPGRRFASMSALLTALASARRSRVRIAAVILGVAILAAFVGFGRTTSPPGAVLRSSLSSIATVATVLTDHAAKDARASLLAPLVAAMEGGRTLEGEALARTILASARAQGDPALEDEAEEWLGRADLQLGRLGEAERRLERVVMHASERGDFARVAGASLLLVDVVGLAAGRADEASEWARRSEAAADRAGVDLELLLEERLAGLSYARGDYDDAEVRLLRVLELREHAEPAKLASLYNSLGAIHGSREDYATALQYFQSARDVRLEIAPEDHPEVLLVRINLARALPELHRGEEAIAELRDIIAISERALGPRHPTTVQAIWSLASTHKTLRQYAGAAREYRSVLAMMDTDQWPVSDRVELLTQLTDCELALGDRRAAEGSAARAVTLAETAELRPPVAAGAQLSYAKAAAAGHRRSAAVRAAERALTILRAGNEPDSVLEADARDLLAELGAGEHR